MNIANRKDTSFLSIHVAVFPALMTGCLAVPEGDDEELGTDPVLEVDGEAIEYGGRGPGNSANSNAEDPRDSLRTLVGNLGSAPPPAAPEVADELFELGRALSFDKVLSGNRNISCLTCHHPDEATSDSRHLPLGEGGVGLGPHRSGGEIIPRNSPHLFNLHLLETSFWDSRVFVDHQGNLVTPAGSELTSDMEDVFDFGVVSAQAMFPVTSNEEMAGHAGENELADAGSVSVLWERLMLRLGAIPEYVEMFEDAYPGTDFEDMSFAHAANAIAGFEIRAFAFIDSPWARFVGGDDDALTRRQAEGALAFFEAGCHGCHDGPGFSDGGHHNTGLVQFGPGKGDGVSGTDDFGWERVTGVPSHRYTFRTPLLLNVNLTGPYGHAGQFGSLLQYVKHYDEAADQFESYRIRAHVRERELYDMVVDNGPGVMSTLSPAVADIEGVDAPAIVQFLGALTDDNARELAHLIPDSVPSGLPVAD